MRRLRGRAQPWFVLGVLLGILGFLVLDGAAAGIVLAVALVALFVGVLRVLSSSDLSGVSSGGEGGGLG